MIYKNINAKKTTYFVKYITEHVAMHSGIAFSTNAALEFS